MERLPTAAVLTVGTELTTGLRRDTNGGDIARALREAGYDVRTLTSVPDEETLLESTIKALTGVYDLVVVTGGLGPTHDDITREAAARALGRGLHREPALVASLEEAAMRHDLPGSRVKMLRQADVIDGATVLAAVTGTAPGQVITEGGSTLILLPGPPSEMRPLLALALGGRSAGVPPVRLKCASITESDAQHLVEPAIAPYEVDLTLLAAPGDVEVVLFARGGVALDLPAAASAAKAALGEACYSTDGSSLAEVIIAEARAAGVTIACAESCTGGMVASALTDVAGASEAFRGGVVAYSNDMKRDVLNVPADVLDRFGAVSEQTAGAMAEGALRVSGATLAVSTTGVAGPDGGSDDKPVGLVWFGIARHGGEVRAVERHLGGNREMVRRRATSIALDLLRREIREG